jgi:hypothetical protein
MGRPEDKAKARRRQTILRALDEQLHSSETPAVKTHYDRLRALGHSDGEVRELMATVLAFYLWHTARKDSYTYDDYVAELERLPQINWQGDEANGHAKA